MSFGSNVLPRKFGRDSSAPGTWECDCPGEVVADGLTMARENPGYLVRCPDCGADRPKEA